MSNTFRIAIEYNEDIKEIFKVSAGLDIKALALCSKQKTV